METDVFFSLAGDVNADAATYAAYKAIETHMREDKYVGFVPSILLLEYLGPFPLVAPSIGGTSDVGGDFDFEPAALRSSYADRSLQISSWTIAACVATLMGSVISYQRL